MKSLITIFLFGCTLLGHAQNNDTIPRSNHQVKCKALCRQLYVPSALIFGGAISEIKIKGSLNSEIERERNLHIPHFKTNADNYLQFSPIVLAYGFDVLGMKSKTDLINRSVILLKSELLMLSTVTALKYTIRELRPDGSDKTSVPSGHTAQAFAAAAFLSEEYGKRYRWVPYLSYTLASTVGALRIMNNKHYLSDVLIGAGIGILSKKISYRTHQYKWNKRKILHSF